MKWPWMEWLLTPLSGSRDHHIAAIAAWHARGMVLAWGILIPLGVLVARYFKVTPKQDWPARLDNRLWWHWHRGLQYAGIGVSLAATYAARLIATGASSAARWHGWLGWAVVSIGAVQVLTGWLRGSKGGPTGEHSADGDWTGDHYDMTRRRLTFEYFHKYVGLVSITAAAATIVLGLAVADAPRWMWLAIFGWWAVIGAVAAYLQASGRCIDTYQAIWGTDPAHPGNRRAPIGLGVHRVAPRLPDASDNAEGGASAF